MCSLSVAGRVLVPVDHLCVLCKRWSSGRRLAVVRAAPALHNKCSRAVQQAWWRETVCCGDRELAAHMICEMTGRRAELTASLLLLVFWSTPASAITGRQGSDISISDNSLSTYQTT